MWLKCGLDGSGQRNWVGESDWMAGAMMTGRESTMRPKGAGGRGGEGVDILGGSWGSRWEVGCWRYGGGDWRGGAERLHGGWEGCQPARETSGGFPSVRDSSGLAVTVGDALLLHNFVLLCSRWPAFKGGVMRKHHRPFLLVYSGAMVVRRVRQGGCPEGVSFDRGRLKGRPPT